MRSGDNIFAVVMNGVVGVIVVSAVFGWLKDHDPGGSFSFFIDPIGSIAMMIVDPSIVILMFAVSMVLASLPGDGF